MENKEEKLHYKINACINIENNIKNINEIKQNIEKCNSEIIKIEFSTKTDEEINDYIKMRKIFGEITGSYKFRFKPGNNYDISNNGKIATKKKWREPLELHYIWRK